MAGYPVSFLTHLSQLRDAIRSLHKGDRLSWLPFAGVVFFSAAILWSAAPTLRGVEPVPRTFLGLVPTDQVLSSDIQKFHWIEEENVVVSAEMQRLRAQLAQLETGLQTPEGVSEEAARKAEEERAAQIKKLKKALRTAEAELQGMRKEKGEIESRLSEVLKALAQEAGEKAGQGQPEGGEEGQDKGREQEQEQGKTQGQEQGPVQGQEQGQEQRQAQGESRAQGVDGQTDAVEKREQGGQSKLTSPPPEAAPAKPEHSAAEQTTSQPESPATEEPVAKQESPAAQEAPPTKDNPAVQEGSLTQEKPPPEDASPRQETSAVQESPPKSDTSAALESPSKPDTPAVQESPPKPDTSAEQESPPKTDAPAVEESPPKPNSPAAEGEWPPISRKTLEEYTQPLSEWPGVVPLMDLSSLRPASALGVPGQSSGVPEPQTPSSAAVGGGGAEHGGVVRLSADGLPRFYVLEAWPDRCAGVAHKRYALKCALGEARALGRALAVHKTTCISTDHTQLPEGLWTASAAYFDFEELANSQPVPIVYIEDVVAAMNAYEAANKPQSQPAESSNSDRDSSSGSGSQFRVREFNLTVPTATLAADNTSDLLLRHLRFFENGFQVCDRDENKHLWPMSPDVPFNRHIVNIAKSILEELGANFTAVHIRRGDKVRKASRWPHLDNDTSPESLREKLPRFAPVGSTLYLATNEEQPHFFDPLKDLYRILRLTDFERLWGPGSEWYTEMQKVLGVEDPKLDIYMTGIVDDYIMGHARRTVETFNDLTDDPRNGIPS